MLFSLSLYRRPHLSFRIRVLMISIILFMMIMRYLVLPLLSYFLIDLIRSRVALLLSYMSHYCIALLPKCMGLITNGTVSFIPFLSFLLSPFFFFFFSFLFFFFLVVYRKSTQLSIDTLIALRKRTFMYVYV